MKAIVRQASTWTTKRDEYRILAAHASIRVSLISDAGPGSVEIVKHVPDLDERGVPKPHPEQPGAWAYKPVGTGVHVLDDDGITYEKEVEIDVDTDTGGLCDEPLARKLDAIRAAVKMASKAFFERMDKLAAIKPGDIVDTDEMEKM
jgi:hypothetical protein